MINKLGGLLLEVEKPARYTGGEYGTLADIKKDAVLKTLIAFPDLYEIGMGNQALKIIYNGLNAIEDICCDRAFAPAPDFENLLREHNIPLYGLDTGESLKNQDILLITLGYEIGLSGIFSILQSSGIPLRCDKRGEEHPIIIAGGPAVSNPLPYSLFIDAFWIGEAEAGFFDLAFCLAKIKKEGRGRAACRDPLLEKISAHPNVWVRGKEKASRAIAKDFSGGISTVYPVPGMKIVQNHGAVEIMRGCPNGCRFCHAGFWYRPMRQKSGRQIITEVDEMVTKGGWHEISLSSLSSGDYNGIDGLVEQLNDAYKDRHVSFQLPSLKVSSFSLSLLEKVSVTRKSGLTFAVETPGEMSQMALNKEVTRDSVVSILEEAKKRGWKTAKFYFMIGLPVPGVNNDEEEIVDFIIDVARRSRMHFNINVGLFVPKPHTPYQGAQQLECDKAQAKMNYIRSALKPLGHKVSISDPVISRLEGLLSRGDERAGALVEEAFLAGSRLDAWSEYIDKEKWKRLLEDNADLVNLWLSGTQRPLPWQAVDSCVSGQYIRSEQEKSGASQRTPTCKEKCSLCGVCGGNVKLIENNSHGGTETRGECDKETDVNLNISEVNENKCDPSIYKVVFSFKKTGRAVFHGHLNLIEMFNMAFTRARLPVKYTMGFNPIPRIETASPLSTGIAAEAEIASVEFLDPISADAFKESFNKALPQGLFVTQAEVFYIPSGTKKHSLSSLLWGFAYKNGGDTDYVKAPDEKAYRLKRLGTDSKSAIYNLNRTGVLAKNINNTDAEEWSTYFNAYRLLYP